jgi:hypothetical protein
MGLFGLPTPRLLTRLLPDGVVIFLRQQLHLRHIPLPIHHQMLNAAARISRPVDLPEVARPYTPHQFAHAHHPAIPPNHHWHPALRGIHPKHCTLTRHKKPYTLPARPTAPLLESTPKPIHIAPVSNRAPSGKPAPAPNCIPLDTGHCSDIAGYQSTFVRLLPAQFPALD